MPPDNTIEVSQASGDTSELNSVVETAQPEEVSRKSDTGSLIQETSTSESHHTSSSKQEKESSVESSKERSSTPEKPSAILQKLKYIVLLAIILLCSLGIYGKLSGWSPWDVFSRVMVLRLPGDAYTVGIILLVLMLIGMAFKKRFFCQFLCPMGAVFSLLPVLPISRIHRNENNCIKGYNACKRNCPVNIKTGENMLRDGECISCEGCMAVCPKKNLTKPENKLLKNDVICIVIKAVLFFVLGCVAGLCRFF